MAKQAKARLDTKGLTGLGLEKLVEILLEESIANRALKARLQTALAGASGPEEIARLIDKRLDALEKARTAINSTRARDLAVELSGLMRNIQSELGVVDPFAAFERLMRLMALRHGIESRLRAESARLIKVFSEFEAAISAFVPSLPETMQVAAVPVLEKERNRDRYGERTEFFAGLLCSLARPAADAWQTILEKQPKAADLGQTASSLLQKLFLQTGNLDAYIALEKAKPENRQDTLAVARMLHDAGRSAEALDWVRKTSAGLRIVIVNGIAAGVGPEYQAQERHLLEAEILDGMKQRNAAQTLRWKTFMETFDPDVLRRYISKLDDFAEFDELDKAFAAVRASRHIHEALLFLIKWPRRDLAAQQVMAHAGQWDGGQYDYLAPAADALCEDQPAAATFLYRVLLMHILSRGLSADYVDAATYMVALAELAPRIEANAEFEDHASFVASLQKKHGRRYAFWEIVPKEFR